MKPFKYKSSRFRKWRSKNQKGLDEKEVKDDNEEIITNDKISEVKDSIESSNMKEENMKEENEISNDDKLLEEKEVEHDEVDGFENITDFEIEGDNDQSEGDFDIIEEKVEDSENEDVSINVDDIFGSEENNEESNTNESVEEIKTEVDTLIEDEEEKDNSVSSDYLSLGEIMAIIESSADRKDFNPAIISLEARAKRQGKGITKKEAESLIDISITLSETESNVWKTKASFVKKLAQLRRSKKGKFIDDAPLTSRRQLLEEVQKREALDS